MTYKLSDEPVIYSAVINSGILMLMAFGLAVTAPQLAAIMVFTNAVIAVSLRGKVSPTTSVAEDGDPEEG